MREAAGRAGPPPRPPGGCHCRLRLRRCRPARPAAYLAIYSWAPKSMRGGSHRSGHSGLATRTGDPDRKDAVAGATDSAGRVRSGRLGAEQGRAGARGEGGEGTGADGLGGGGGSNRVRRKRMLGAWGMEGGGRGRGALLRGCAKRRTTGARGRGTGVGEEEEGGGRSRARRACPPHPGRGEGRVAWGRGRPPAGPTRACA